MSRVIPKLALAILTPLALVLLVEGTLSLAFQRSLRSKPALDPSRLFAPGGENLQPTSGIFASHLDPAVAHVLRARAELHDRTATFHTTPLGMRVRPGPPPPENALRIVVLGDSVAFGAALNDDETIAAQLERVLNESRGPSLPPVACFTVAVPGWNHRNAVHFLEDHFEEYRPDVVLYLPVSNDLYDSLAIGESGVQQIAPDVMSADPLLTVNHESLFAYQFMLSAKVQSGEVKNAVTALDDLGPQAVLADLTPESKRRYDDNAESIVRLQLGVESRGARLAIMFFAEFARSSPYAWILRERLLERGERAATEIPALEDMSIELGHPGDPHPNAECARGLALLAAEGLLARKLVDPGEARPLPDLPAEVAKLRAPPRDAESIRAQAEHWRAEGLRILQSEIDLSTGRGFQQVIGGMNPDGSARCRFACIVKASGRTLRLTLAAIPDKSFAYPLEVKVHVDGEEFDTVTIAAGVTDTVDAYLPDSVKMGAPIEVKLVPERWTMSTFEKRPIVASFVVKKIWFE